ncbi:MAG: helix-turn-helix domain-containing protein [Prevotella sp.]|jgi:transcriptional regulator with XRE-family HTH domain|nr:helix-turn-helix domain-containing protein [Prevotella sp.]
MSEEVIKNSTKHQGRNVRFSREFRGLSQFDLADKINKHQSDISRIENQQAVDDEILDQIALALEVSADFLKNFDFGETAKTFNNYSADTHTNTFSENSNGTVNQQTQGEQENNIINNFPLDDYKELTEKFLDMQRKLLTEKSKMEVENALLKEQIELLKKK